MAQLNMATAPHLERDHETDEAINLPQNIDRTWRGRAGARHTAAVSEALRADEQREDHEQLRVFRITVLKAFEELWKRHDT